MKGNILIFLLAWLGSIPQSAVQAVTEEQVQVND